MKDAGKRRDPNVLRGLIARSGITIYDRIDPNDPLFLTPREIERLLQARLKGRTLGYALRTRAKVAKALVVEALGYPSPSSFRKTQPRFPGQNLDVYVQKSDNLQIWNEEIDPARRYALIRLDADDTVVAVRVLTGEAVAKLDPTGTLTSKYQAKRQPKALAEGEASVLVSRTDTGTFVRTLRPVTTITPDVAQSISPADPPLAERILTIQALWDRLRGLVGAELRDPGPDQERNRGAELHRLVCGVLGLGAYRDRGQFPDIPCQALEVKLQTSPTIDLGLVSPDSDEPIVDLGPGLRHCDMRYAVFYAASIPGGRFGISSLVLSTGQDFFSEFRRFGGLVQNRKLQIPLPRDLFGETE